MNGDPKLARLVARHLEDRLTDEEWTELRARLRNNAADRAYFNDMIALHAALTAGGSLIGSVLSAPHRPEPFHFPPVLRWRGGLAAAAAVALLLGLAWISGPRVDAPVFARAVRSLDAEFVGASIRQGEEVQRGQFRLVRGGMEFVTLPGTKVVIDAPAEFGFESPQRLRLFSGRVAADVPASAIGFTVVTRAGEVVDLGTRFGVEADASGESRVAVFDGQVKVRAEGTGGNDYTLLEQGEAVRMQAQNELLRWSNVTVHEPHVSTESVIAEVRDTLDAPTFRRFYALVPGGMRHGTAAYTDRPDAKWSALPGEVFPGMLEGCDLVRTFHADRHDRSFALTLALSSPAEVFVMFDTRKSPPPWLRDQFTDTGVRLQVGPWNSPNLLAGTSGRALADRQVYCSVWRAVADAGEIVLRLPHNRQETGPNVMYGVAARRR